MANIYVLGSLNIDLVFESDKLIESGETYPAKNFFINEGGKGANQAVACSKCGSKTYLIGCVGNDDFKDRLLNTLKDNNVDISFVKEKNANCGVAGILLYNNDNRILISGGANLLVSNSDIDEAFININKDDILICQLENNIEAITYAIKKAKEKNVTIIFNPAPIKKIDKDVLSNIDFLILNENESKTLSNSNTLEEMKNYFNSLNIKNVIVTLGSNGCLYFNSINSKKYDAYKINVIDTTGAGDTFVGSFASKYLINKNIDEAINFALKASALTCLKKGAIKAIPTLKEINDF